MKDGKVLHLNHLELETHSEGARLGVTFPGELLDNLLLEGGEGVNLDLPRESALALARHILDGLKEVA